MFERSVWLAAIRKIQPSLLGLYVVSLATSMSGMEICATLIFFTAIVIFILEGEFPKSAPPFVLPMAVFIGITVLGIVLGNAPVSDKLYDIQRMRFFFLYVFLYYFMSSNPKPWGWLSWLCAIGVLVGIYGFVQHFISIDLFRPEAKKVAMYVNDAKKIGPMVVGTFNHHLTFANIYLPFAGLFFSLGLFFFPRKMHYLGLGVLFYLLCFWTHSRIAWVAIPVSLWCLCWAKGKKTVVGLGVVFLAIVAMSCAMDAGFRERIDKIWKFRENLSQLDARSRLWAVQWHFFQKAPILGVGYNNNERVCREVMDGLFPDVENNFCGHAHSTPLQLLATTGILGLLSYFWIWIAVFKRNMNLIRHLPQNQMQWWIALACWVAFVCFHIQGLTQWNFGDAEALHNLAFFWALLASLEKPRLLS